MTKKKERVRLTRYMRQALRVESGIDTKVPDNHPVKAAHKALLDRAEAYAHNNPSIVATKSELKTLRKFGAIGQTHQARFDGRFTVTLEKPVQCLTNAYSVQFDGPEAKELADELQKCSEELDTLKREIYRKN